MDTLNAKTVVEWCFLSKSLFKALYIKTLKEYAETEDTGISNPLSEYNRTKHKLNILNSISEKRKIIL